MDFLGDYIDDATVRIYFSTNNRNGGAVAPSSAFEAADVLIYKDGSATQKTTTNGVTMTSPFDAITGLHLVEIDTSVDTGDTGFWQIGHDYTVVLSPDETIDSQTVVQVLGQFAIENRAGLLPTVAGRKLDVSTGGEAGLDWANVGSPTTTVGLSGTTVKTATDVETDTQNIQSRLPAALDANGFIKSDPLAWNGTIITETLADVAGIPSVNTVYVSGDSVAADNLEKMLDGTGGVTLTTNITGNLTGNLVGSVTGSVNSVTGSVGGTVGTVLGLAANTVTASALAADAAAELADAIWDEARSGHVAVGTFGEYVNARLTGTLTTLDELWTKIKKWLQLGFRKDAAIATDNATELTEINANGGSGAGAFANTTDALEAIRDRGDAAWGSAGGGASAQDVWEYATRTLTQGAASVIAAVTGSSITVYRGTTWSISLTGLGDISLYDKVYFSVKSLVSDPDTRAILRVRNEAGNAGLERFNKAAPTAATNGYVTINSAPLGNITITVLEAETQNAPVRGNYVYDVKGVDSDGNVVMLSAGGLFDIEGDVTRAIS